LEQLTDYDQFERFCSDLMVLEGYDGLEPLGGHKDKGRDALHTAKNGGTNTVFAYSVREDWLEKLNEDAEKVKNHGHACDDLVFLSTANFTATERDNAIKDVKAKYGFSALLYGLERLRMLLNKHPQLITQHPHIFHPAFFANQSTTNVTSPRDLLVIDNVVEDDTMATWLARRLQLEGYQVWSKATSPVAGSSVNDTIEKLVKSRAFRLLQIMSPSAVADNEFNSRRSFAFGVTDNLVLPLAAADFDAAKLDSKSSKLETVSFAKSWAEGLSSLLKTLADFGCPGFRDATTRLSTSFGVMPGLVKEEPERVISSQFEVVKIPKSINRYVTDNEINEQELQELSLQWAFRKVDNNRFLSFFAPPADLKRKLAIKDKGGAVWDIVTEIDKIAVKILLPELIRKSLIVHSISKGLKYCPEFDGLYFPENLVPSDRLNFTRPDGDKSFVGPVGQRKFWRPAKSTIYKYALSPLFRVVDGYESKYRVQLKTRIRFTDEDGSLLPSKTAFSRRKHLCRSWFNYEWLHRMLAMIQFLSENGTISIGPTGGELIVAATPNEWLVPLRINEDALTSQEADREEMMAYSRDDDDDDDADKGESSGDAYDDS
jgi:hypothetical protein